MKTSVIAVGGISVLLATVFTSAAVIGIQSVAAQTEATSTPPAEGESVEQPADAGTQAATTSENTALDTASTTEPAADAATSTSTPSVAASEEAEGTKPGAGDSHG
jgi:cytoskeletal protein RodZ